MVGISKFLGNLNFLGKLFYSQEEVQRYRAMIVEVMIWTTSYFIKAALGLFTQHV